MRIIWRLVTCVFPWRSPWEDGAQLHPSSNKLQVVQARLDQIGCLLVLRFQLGAQSSIWVCTILLRRPPGWKVRTNRPVCQGKRPHTGVVSRIGSCCTNETARIHSSFYLILHLTSSKEHERTACLNCFQTLGGLRWDCSSSLTNKQDISSITFSFCSTCTITWALKKHGH